jgi:hypothetical protein
MNLRKARRMECLFPATVKVQGLGHKAVILDISLSGCRICLDGESGEASSIDIDKIIELSFLLSGMTEEQVISGKIQYMKKDDRHTEAGVQFDPENVTVLGNVKLYMDRFPKLWFLPAVKTLPEQGQAKA